MEAIEQLQVKEALASGASRIELAQSGLSSAIEPSVIKG